MATVEERNKAVIAKYFTEYWGELNPDIVDEVCADNMIQSYPMHANPKKGKVAVKQAIVDFKAVYLLLKLSSITHKHSQLTKSAI
jgi:hypothetical protein